MWIGVWWAGLRVAMWITHVGVKFRDVRKVTGRVITRELITDYQYRLLNSRDVFS